MEMLLSGSTLLPFPLVGPGPSQNPRLQVSAGTHRQWPQSLKPAGHPTTAEGFTPSTFPPGVLGTPRREAKEAVTCRITSSFMARKLLVHCGLACCGG